MNRQTTEVTVTSVKELIRMYNKFQRRIIASRSVKGICGEDVIVLTICTD